MEVLATSDLLRDVNLFRTAHYPVEVMLYFEKHHIFEVIFDLLILLDRKRPEDLCQFIAENLEKLATKYRKVNVAVHCSPNIELEKFAKVCSRVQRAPVVQVMRPGSRRSLKKLPEELKRFKLDNKNLLFIAKDSKIIDGSLAKEFLLHRKMSYVPEEEDSTSKTNSVQAFTPAAMNFKNTLKLLERCPNHEQVKYVERIAIIGRPGSGVHRQARLLANRLDLVLVSVNELVNRARLEKNYFKNTLEIGFEDNVHTSELICSMVEKRLLEPDCLRYGWVLLDFPNTAEDVENLFHLSIAPQKVFLLHTNERLCWKRKTKQNENATHMQLDEAVLKAQFNFYEMHKSGTIEALERQNCILLDVNGNRSVEKIHGDILTKLMKF